MSSLVTVIVLIIVVLVAWSMFSNEINAYLENGKSMIRDNTVSLPNPVTNTPVYDLQVDFKPKIKYSFGLIVFLNSEGGTFERKWTSPHLYQASILNSLIPFSLIDYYSERINGLSVVDLATNEIIVPAFSGVPHKFTFSFILVDPDSGLQKKLPKYQDVPFSIPSFTTTYSVTQKLLFEDIEKKDWELWIVPGGDGVRFVDHEIGEKYIQKISP